MAEARSFLNVPLGRQSNSRPPTVAKLALLGARSSAWLFGLIVVLPAIIYFVYLAAVASPRYVSEFRVIVRSAGQTRDFSLPQMAGLSLPSQSNENSYAVIQYLKSQPAALELNATAGLRDIYSSDKIDPTSRLSQTTSNYALTRYWNSKLDAYYENTTSTIIVRVTAFDPNTARNIANSTLGLSERLVNGMSQRSRNDLVAYAQKDVSEAALQLQAIDAKLYALRNQRGLIDPRQTATATLERQSKVQDEITAVQVQISARRAYLSPSSPVMQALYKRLAALQAGLQAINAEAVATAPGSTETLAGSINAFEKLQADEAFAQKQYQIALTSLQDARAENARQQLYLETIVPPTLPDQQVYPNLLKDMGIFLIFAVALWGIISVTIKNLVERF